MKRFISVALVLIMIFAVASVAAAALESPGGKTYYSVTTSSEGNGEAHSDKNKVNVKPSTTDDGHVTLTAEEEGGKFIKWVIEGDYNPISGDENSPVFVIEPLSDIKAVAVFEGGSTEPVVIPTEAGGNTSPKTGDPTMMIIVLALAAMGLGVFAVKKIKE